jgi:hypothetical protein
MIIPARVSVALLALALATVPASAIASSVAGEVRLTLDDRVTREFTFRAVGRDDGSATGDFVFTDPEALPGVDPDDPGKEPERGLSFAASIDCLVVEKNVGVMSGVIEKSTFPESVGQRVLLTVEDGGGARIPDGLTWGIYDNTRRDWIPADAELKDDRGWFLTWHATDAERRDDVGFDIVRDPVVGCDTFPLFAYEVFDVREGEGKIEVVP